jgi:hypothetical protein
MNTSKSVPLTETIPHFVHNLTPRIARRRLLAACVSLPVCFLLLLIVRQFDPITDLETAKARWAATGISDYRIVVEFQRPYLTCQQDFEVRGTDIGYKHKDTCNMGGAITGNRNTNWPTVANLFDRIEDGQKTQQCGPNGCICDGPIVMEVVYDPERGYPQEINYTLRQDLRSRDLQYWLAMLNGSLAQCPQVTYIGETIRVTSLEALPPLVEQLSESTPEIGIGDPTKPEATVEAAPEISLGDAIKPEITPVN